MGKPSPTYSKEQSTPGLVIRKKEIMARSNRKRREAGMKFDGYISFFGEGGGNCVLVLHKKRKKDEKGEKKNQVKVFKMGHL